MGNIVQEEVNMYRKLIAYGVLCLGCTNLHASGMAYDVGTGAQNPSDVWITNYTMDLQVPQQFINPVVGSSTYQDYAFVFIWPGFGSDAGRYNNSYPTQSDIVGGGVLQPVLTYSQQQPYPNPNNVRTNGWWISGQAVGYLPAVYSGFRPGSGRVGWTGGDVLPVNQGDILTIAMTLNPGQWTQSISNNTQKTSVLSWPFNMSEASSTLGQSQALLKAAQIANSPQQKQNAAQLFIENVLGPPINAATFSNIKIYTSIANPAFCQDMRFTSQNDYINANCTGAKYYPSTQFGQSYCQINQCIVYADPILILPGLQPGVSYSLSYDAGSGFTQCINSIQNKQSDNSLLLLFHGGSMQLFCDRDKPLGPVPKQIQSLKLTAPGGGTLQYNNIQFNAITGIYTMQLDASSAGT